MTAIGSASSDPLAATPARASEAAVETAQQQVAKVASQVMIDTLDHSASCVASDQKQLYAAEVQLGQAQRQAVAAGGVSLTA